MEMLFTVDAQLELSAARLQAATIDGAAFEPAPGDPRLAAALDPAITPRIAAAAAALATRPDLQTPTPTGPIVRQPVVGGQPAERLP